MVSSKYSKAVRGISTSHQQSRVLIVLALISFWMLSGVLNGSARQFCQKSGKIAVVLKNAWSSMLLKKAVAESVAFCIPDDVGNSFNAPCMTYVNTKDSYNTIEIIRSSWGYLLSRFRCCGVCDSRLRLEPQACLPRVGWSYKSRILSRCSFDQWWCYLKLWYWW